MAEVSEVLTHITSPALASVFLTPEYMLECVEARSETVCSLRRGFR
jgi:hypothetical protein